ncbi:LysR family transcriptional regulator [Acetonema longum]|uniref:LysR family transcriptional regulator n=1 Tax=Acetonema longum DSM 6540 TaxID=1009370 RepID=F7NFD2_9FIRM|nr:LysR family transcriptional regulator [Acetonema longum]EGO65257.1 LysR family transcriptional regulator [Acetonema longum DSM 6540]
MNFLNLEYFLIAAEELNFTKAAKRLYISQQSLSNHIAKLEEHFGLPLFDRTPPMTLTSAGLSLVKRARSLLDAKNETELELQDIKDFRSGYLSVGVTHARGTVILPMVLPPFHRMFPQVKLQLVEGTSQQLEDALLNGNVDLTIGFKPANASNVESEMLLDETSVLVVPHPLLKKYLPGKSLELCNTAAAPVREILRQCPFVTISATTWAGAILERYCRKTGITPRVVVETVNIATLVALCLEGMGAIVCPRIFLHKLNIQLNAEKLRHVSIYPLDLEPEHHVIALNYMKHKYLSQSAREFIRITKEIFRSEA